MKKYLNLIFISELFTEKRLLIQTQMHNSAMHPDAKERLALSNLLKKFCLRRFLKINIPFQFTGTGQKLEAFDTLVYFFLEITYRKFAQRLHRFTQSFFCAKLSGL